MVVFNIFVAESLFNQLVVTPNGEWPTKDNSVPLDTANEADGSRCSMVWFTQGTVLQNAYLKFSTVKKTKEMEKKAQRKCPRAEPYYPTEFNAAKAFTENIFPRSHPHTTPTTQS